MLFFPLSYLFLLLFIKNGVSRNRQLTFLSTWIYNLYLFMFLWAWGIKPNKIFCLFICFCFVCFPNTDNFCKNVTKYTLSIQSLHFWGDQSNHSSLLSLSICAMNYNFKQILKFLEVPHLVVLGHINIFYVYDPRLQAALTKLHIHNVHTHFRQYLFETKREVIRIWSQAHVFHHPCGPKETWDTYLLFPIPQGLHQNCFTY